MSEWKSYTELTEEYNQKIEELNTFLKEHDDLQPPKRKDLLLQLDSMIRSVYEMRPYVEREKRKTEVGET